MSRRSIYIAAVLAVAFAGLFYFFRSGTLTHGKGTSQALPKGQTSEAGHAGHAGGPANQAQASKDEEETPAVEVPADRQKLIGAKTAEVAVRSFKKTIRTVGLIQYDEKKISTINTRFEGWIEKLYVDYTGRYVKKGEPMAEIYSPELFATQQELLNLLRWNDAGKTGDGAVSRMMSKDSASLLEAARQRLRLWDISDEQIKKIEASGRPMRTLTISSPSSGYVVQKMALQGMKVMPGEKLFDIADLSTVWVISDIYEYELPMIKVGQTASIRLSYLPGKELKSKVDYVYPGLSGETRSAKIRFTIPNPGGQLKPQMFTDVEILTDMGRKLSIPDDAVIDTGVRQLVYVDTGDGFFEPREVKLGARVEGLREVISGLTAGEKVSSSATFLIDSEAQLKGVQPLEKNPR